MILRNFVLGPIANNCYLLYNDSKEAVLVDASWGSEEIVRWAEKNKIVIKYLVLSHGHIDHVIGADTIRDAFGTKVCIHKEDLWLYDHTGQQAMMFGFESAELKPPDQFITEKTEFKIGNEKIRILETPGHSPGSVTLVVESITDGGRSCSQALMTGDCVFRGSIGRTDFWGGSYGTIMKSIREKILPFPDQTIVYPGHGDVTDLGFERKYNPFITGQVQ